MSGSTDAATDSATDSATDADADSPNRRSSTGGGLVARIDGAVGSALAKAVVMAALVFTLLMLLVPIVFTFVASFAETAVGALPSGFVTLENWRTVLGLGDFGVRTNVAPGLAYSAMLATGGMLLNIVIGVPIAYALTRYDFFLRDWINAVAILPLVPGIILGIAFLRTYPENAGSALGLVVGYALLKSPYMVLTVQSSFQSMELQQLEESARSLGASWPRTFLTVIVPNAKDGIIAGSIICWTLAAAEFNFTYMVYARGPQPFSLFLFENISNAPYLQSAAAISVYFLIVVAAIGVLQIFGNRGFSTSG